MVGTAVTPVDAVAPPAAEPAVALVAGAAAAVPVAEAAGVKPLNWARLTPEDAARPLNWLSKEDSSASMSVGLWTVGISVAIF